MQVNLQSVLISYSLCMYFHFHIQCYTLRESSALSPSQMTEMRNHFEHCPRQQSTESKGVGRGQCSVQQFRLWGTPRIRDQTYYLRVPRVPWHFENFVNDVLRSSVPVNVYKQHTGTGTVSPAKFIVHRRNLAPFSVRKTTDAISFTSRNPATSSIVSRS